MGSFSSNFLHLLLLFSTVRTTFCFLIAPPMRTTSRRLHERSTATAMMAGFSDDEMLVFSDDDGHDGGPKLGINFGHNLNPMSETEKQLLNDDAKKIIDDEISKGILDLGRLRDRWHREIEVRNDSLEQAMTLNGIRESEKFDIKINNLIGTFLSETSVSRARTHYLAWVAEQKAKEGEREEKRKSAPKENRSWGKTNNEWDDWDDWNYRN